MNNGIEYFPLNVHLDDKIELIEAEFGLTGFSVVVKLFQRIYGGQGYYCEWTNDVALLFSKNIGLGCNVVSEIVSAAIKRGIFDQDIYEKYQVLTSRGIQKRYFEAVSRRVNVEVKKAYLLFPVAQKYKNVCILDENVYISQKNAYRNGQSKVKESKVKESRVEESSIAVVDENLKEVVSVYENNIAPITTIVRDKIINWMQDIEPGVIRYAIEEAATHNARNWNYIEAILKNHFNAGRKTLDAVQGAAKPHDRQELNVYKDETGYDYDKIEDIMRQKYDKPE